MTGRPNGPKVNTPSDGYRKLAVDILLDAVKANDLDFLSTPLGQACFDILDVLPGPVITALKKRNGNGHAD